MTEEKYREFYSELKITEYKILEAEGISHISHLDTEFRYGVAYFTDILRSKENIKELPFSDFKIYDELDFITQDLKYIIAVLQMLRPYINKPAQEDGTYIQKWEDHIYLRYATFGYQSLYNFWDRLGDILYIYFVTGLHPKKAYLGLVLDKVEQEIKNTLEYHALKSFYDQEIKPRNEFRHDIVHGFQLKSKHRWAHVEHHGNAIKQEEIYGEKFGYLDDLKRQFKNCLSGYLLTLDLLKVLPDKT